jgi:hypothetical protein
MDVFALVKSMATGAEWTRQRVAEELKVSVSYYKGPYTIDPLIDVVEGATSITNLFRDVSPTFVERVLTYTAKTYLQADDPYAPQIMEEIKTGTGGALATIGAAPEAMLKTVSDEAAAAGVEGDTAGGAGGGGA